MIFNVWKPFNKLPVVILPLCDQMIRHRVCQMHFTTTEIYTTLNDPKRLLNNQNTLHKDQKYTLLIDQTTLPNDQNTLLTGGNTLLNDPNTPQCTCMHEPEWIPPLLSPWKTSALPGSKVLVHVNYNQRVHMKNNDTYSFHVGSYPQSCIMEQPVLYLVWRSTWKSCEFGSNGFQDFLLPVVM